MSWREATPKHEAYAEELVDARFVKELEDLRFAAQYYK
jgi:hypothetical protein